MNFGAYVTAAKTRAAIAAVCIVCASPVYACRSKYAIFGVSFVVLNCVSMVVMAAELDGGMRFQERAEDQTPPLSERCLMLSK